ncbi:hypothetical protein [Acidimangrovimonas sediminis]|uniref:hypothetical protein n=1 Tax=Acidimangrovimonas sediminis TaxID=2056283 RepID=UPI000C8054D1|nr:hypothetical protein [Acidimangrovimonas sediminis]
MTLWLHIGHGKTGSSALQAGLVRGRGFVYPQTGRSAEGDHNRLFPVDPPIYGPQMLDRIAAARDEIGGGDGVLSSESLCFAGPAKVAQLAEVFSGADLRILYYVRRQEDLVESGFRQHQRGRLRVARDVAKTVEDYLATHGSSFDFLKRIAPWEEVFGRERVTARLYDRKTCAGDVCADFAAVTGFAVADTGARANPSLDVPLTRALMLYREVEPDPERQMAFRAGLERIVAEIGPSPARFVDDAMRARIREMFAESNATFAARHLDARAAEILTTS